MTTIKDLPLEMILHIASFLSLEDKKSLRSTSTQLKNAISTYHDFDRAKSISSQQALENFIATFKSRIEAQETQEVIGKDSDSPEHPSPEYLFKEIKLILNHGLIKSIKKDHFKFLSSAAKEVCVAIDLSEVKDVKTLEDSCKRIKSQISQLDNVKIKELNLRDCHLTPQNAAIIIKSLPSGLESLNLSSNDFSDNPKVLADVLSGKEIKSGKITNLNLESCKLTPQNAAIIIQGLSANNLESLNLESNKFGENVEELANALRGKKIKELNLKWCSLTAQNAAKIIEKADAKTIIVSSNIFIFNQIDPIIQALKQTSCKIEECVLGSDDWNRMAQDAISERIRSNQQKTILDNIDFDAILELVSDMPL